MSGLAEEHFWTFLPPSPLFPFWPSHSPPPYSSANPVGYWGGSAGMVLSTEAERTELGRAGTEAGAEAGTRHSVAEAEVGAGIRS